MKVDLGYNVFLNSNSSLHREFLAIKSTLPVYFVGTPGITVKYQDESRYSSGKFIFQTETSIHTQGPSSVTAFKVVFVTFDIFGKRTNTLSATEIQDIPTGKEYKFTWKWNLYNENDAEKHFASVAFVDKVRTADGQVHIANYDEIVDVLQRFAIEVTESDLKPDPEEKKN